MTPIKAERKTKTINYGDEPVSSFWLETPPSFSAVPNTDHFARIQNILESGVKDGVICVFSEELSSKRLCELLAKMRDNGNRVYILTNNFHEELRNLNGCLIRYGGGRKIGSFILINPNSGDPSGCLFTGHLSDGSLQLAENLLLDLASEQISVLFRYFCYQFWKFAAKEYIGFEERDTDSAPVDIYPPSNDGCDFQYLQSIWGKEMDGTFIRTTRLSENSFFKFDNISHSNVISLYSGIDNEIVRSLKQKNNKIIAIDDVCFVNSVKTGNDFWLVPKIDTASESEVYALLLNDEQLKIFSKHIDRLLPSKSLYEYFESESRKNLSGKNIVRLGDAVSQKYTISPENRIKLNDYVPPELPLKDQFDKNEPDFPDDGQSISIVYEWTNKPFTLPEGGAKHTLYTEWENAQKRIIAHIDDIINAIAENEKKEKTISSRIKHLFLGKQQKFTEYRKDLDALKTADYGSLEKNALQAKIAGINHIRANVVSDTGEIDDENRKAGIADEISVKQAKKAVLEAEQSAKEKEAADLENKRQELEDVFYGKGYIQKGESPPKFYDGLKKQIESAKMEKKDGIEELEKKRAETKKFMDEFESFKMKYRSLQSDAGETGNKIKRITTEIDALEKQLKDSGSKKSEEQKKGSALKLPGKKSNAGSMDSSKDLIVPQLERLPSTGKLYLHNKQGYLTIEYWEEYNEGKNEAQRLKANLCAKGEK
jgi:hypothetical protein